ncbi:hypothetical protein FPQ18DRAFT_410601 [Pyronema domesticum]|uniref:Similar to Pc21g21910 [Penicillium chrysogenum Wisconsin 54-1255] acc. no. XP_002569162 n=1 Tax=Pyronema omphalodes (strain CBS 100304) TaxID=1076935 RepID=U4LWF0_PYROM|nr:hypothetical protein FPQ18DRAFT_410601 [Pyronema domesticum]CCX33683.1 Similar to Pc21g21910 [Penicillium chrysogenum Wisconsin 54-1255]; acc. no. XP_002569162 [Pyronema omphalodes CBS 100304]
MEKIDLSHFENSNISHVRDKFQLKKEGDYISERLGKANTKRRQLLTYNENHHEKLVGRRPDDMRAERNDSDFDGKGKGNDRDLQSDSAEDVLGFGQKDYMSQTASRSWGTTASTVHEEGFTIIFHQ